MFEKHNCVTPTVLTPSSSLLVLFYPSAAPPLQKAIRVTTFMQRLKNSEALIDSSAETQASKEKAESEGGVSLGTGDEGEKGADDTEVISSSVCLQVTVENTQLGMDKEEVDCKVEREDQDPLASTRVGPSVGTSPSDVWEVLCPQDQPAAELPKQPAVKMAAGEVGRKMAANLGQSNVSSQPNASSTYLAKPSQALTPTVNINKKATSPDPGSKRKMAASLHGAQTSGSQNTGCPSAAKENQRDEAGSWCQTQVPDGVAETVLALAPPAALGRLEAGVDLSPSTKPRMSVEPSPASRRDGEARKSDRHSAEFIFARAAAGEQGCYRAENSPCLGRRTNPGSPDIGVGAAGSYNSLYSPLFVSSGGGMEMYGTGLPHVIMGGGSDWQMDSVIEQIEKQMAAVLEKIEGDMPSLLEQISDCPAEAQARSAHASPASPLAHPSRRPGGCGASGGGTPPPLPTSPRPVFPPLPHLSITPPSYQPPSPPTQSPPQAAREQEELDGHRDTTHSRQSPRAEMERGL